MSEASKPLSFLWVEPSVALRWEITNESDGVEADTEIPLDPFLRKGDAFQVMPTRSGPFSQRKISWCLQLRSPRLSLQL